MRNRGAIGCKTIDIILDGKVDTQQILDIMLTFVESTIQRTNSGSNCMNKNITMKELIAVVKILSYIQLTQFEEDILVNIISQNIDKNNWLYAVYESYLKLQESEMQERCKYWFPLFNIMIDFWCFNLRYLLRWQKPMINELRQASDYVIEVMINKCLLFYFPDPFYNNSDIIEFIMETKNQDSVFDLLKSEKQKVLNTENNHTEDQPKQTDCFSWKIKRFKGNYYKETEPFMAEEWFWSISMSYVQREEESLNISIRVCNNPYEQRSKMYFKKEEYYYRTPDDHWVGQTGKPQEECSINGFAQHAIVFIWADIKLRDSDEFKNIRVFPMICSSKIPTLLAKIPKSELDKFDEEYEIFFYIKIKPNLSSMINYISFNFDIIHDDPKIRFLEPEDLHWLLRHKDLSVGHEDVVLRSLWLWRSYQPMSNDYRRIFNWVNWHFWTLDCILRMLYKYKSVRSDPVITNLIQLEFLRRCKKSIDRRDNDLNPPRFRYKYVGGIKSMSVNNGEDNNNEVMAFLTEDSSKMFIERMFEWLINIMKTSKITMQDNKMIIADKIADEPKNWVNEEKKDSPLEFERRVSQSESSEGEFESEYESDSEEQMQPSKASSRNDFFQQLNDPSINLMQVMSGLLVKKQDKEQERDKILKKLKNYEELDKHLVEESKVIQMVSPKSISSSDSSRNDREPVIVEEVKKPSPRKLITNTLIKNNVEESKSQSSFTSNLSKKGLEMEAKSFESSKKIPFRFGNKQEDSKNELSISENKARPIRQESSKSKFSNLKPKNNYMMNQSTLFKKLAAGAQVPSDINKSKSMSYMNSPNIQSNQIF